MRCFFCGDPNAKAFVDSKQACSECFQDIKIERKEMREKEKRACKKQFDYNDLKIECL